MSKTPNPSWTLPSVNEWVNVRQYVIRFGSHGSRTFTENSLLPLLKNKEDGL